jgi:acyl transferase domain-containing protein
MKKPLIWMFSGQGSHYYQMGLELFEHEPVFRKTFEQGSDLVQNLTNESLSKIVFGPRQNRFEPFKRTLLTHPAIFLVEMSLAELLKSRGMRPDKVLGYSVGEFASFVVAGVLGFEEALIAVVKQAELIEYGTPPVAMVAILEHPDICKEWPNELHETKIVARNFEKGFISACPEKFLPKLLAFLKSKSINAMELPVSHGFHSPWMDSIETSYKNVLTGLNLKPAQVEMWSAASGKIDQPNSHHLWTATRSSIDFREVLRKLELNGPNSYLDLGPSGTMATLVKHNLSHGAVSDHATIMNPFGRLRNHLEKALQPRLE